MPGQTINNNVVAESSRKRQRRALADEDDQDEETLEVQQASSGLRQDGRKRVRVSDATSRKGRVSLREITPDSSGGNDGDDAADAEAVDESPNSPAKTQYEMLRDDGFKFTQYEDADDWRATQRMLSRPVRARGDKPADNGILESITCVNFMCHTRLHCELGPFLNFIVGENGSGKSAILTAITLCLGGKASSTNRGGSLKSFVKEGQDRAMLCIRIRNRGEDAYKHDLYGDSIIIERHFNKTSGSSGFKVKSVTNHVISNKRQEVDEIVEYFTLQVDNPLCVLSQDNARQFLNASSKAQKYKFFLEGVQLQQLDIDYRLMAESLDQAEAKRPEQEDRRKRAEEEWQKAKRLVEALDSNNELRRKARAVGNMLAWVQVRDQERILANREANILQVESEIAAAEQLVREKTQALEIADDKIRQTEERVKAAQEERTEIKTRVDAANEEYQSRKSEVMQLHNDERDAFGKASAAKTELTNVETQISDEEQSLEAVNGGAHTRKQEELAAAKAELRAIEKELDETKVREPELISQCQSAQNSMRAAAAAVTSKRGDIAAVEGKIRSLEQDHGTMYAGYEAGVPALLKMIEQQNGFDSKPIGPLGAYIHLSAPRWSSILETTLGTTPNAFLVSSHRDQKLLTQLMNRANVRKCPIFISNANRNPINTEGKEPDDSFDTILRVLKFDNPRVRDQLIIAHQIEKTILIPDRKKGSEVMMPNHGPPPRNVAACLCFHDAKHDEGVRITSSESAPVKTGRFQRSRMQTDSSSEMEVQKEVLARLETELRELDGDKRRADQEHQRYQSELARLRNSRKTLANNERKARVTVGSIEDELEKFEGASARLHGLKNMLDENKGKVEHFATQYAELSIKKEEKNQEVDEAQRRLKAEKAQLTDAESKVNKTEDKLTRMREARDVAVMDKNDAFSAVQEKREVELPRAIESRDRHRAEVEMFVLEASKVCPRMEPPEAETQASLDKQYNILLERIKKQESKQGMTDDEAHALFRRAESEYRQIKKLVQSTAELNQRIKESLVVRARKWHHFRRLISAHARSNFARLLHERGFAGRLLLDHERKLLDLRVEPADGDRVGGRSTKTLSGGEKSFSSICLLLSIWEAIGSPLRCLDEFDVFMDNVNRSISTGMLISAARQSINKQYIFITPNAIEGRANLDADVKIIRLTDPRQRTLTDHH